jgi:vacuolar-type H+-ATPase subunit I/STV1
MKKTRKVEAAEVQLKRKVKALEMKCAELQQRAKAAEEANSMIVQERSERERELTEKLKVAQQEAVQAERDWKYCADGWNKTSKELVDLMVKVDLRLILVRCKCTHHPVPSRNLFCRMSVTHAWESRGDVVVPKFSYYWKVAGIHLRALRGQ